jgi:hypothetical protein
MIFCGHSWEDTLRSNLINLAPGGKPPIAPLKGRTPHLRHIIAFDNKEVRLLVKLLAI